jgi:hypothetical protein
MSESQAFPRHLVQSRSLDHLLPITPQLTPAQIISEDENDVGAGGGMRRIVGHGWGWFSDRTNDDRSEHEETSSHQEAFQANCTGPT